MTHQQHINQGITSWAACPVCAATVPVKPKRGRPKGSGKPKPKCRPRGKPARRSRDTMAKVRACRECERQGGRTALEAEGVIDGIAHAEAGLVGAGRVGLIKAIVEKLG